MSLLKVLVLVLAHVLLSNVPPNFGSKIEDLSCTDDGEPSEKSHGASDC